MSSLTTRLTLVVPVLAALAAACGSDSSPESDLGEISFMGLPDTAAGANHADDLGFDRALVLSPAWRNGRAVQTLDLGPWDGTFGILYVLKHAGAVVPGQDPILSAIPGDDGYSPVLRIVDVEVPSSYDGNDIKSEEGLLAAGYTLTDTPEALACAVVDADIPWVTADLASSLTVYPSVDAPLENDAFDPEMPVGPDNSPTLTGAQAAPGDIVLTRVWYKQHRAHCWHQPGPSLMLTETGLAVGQTTNGYVLAARTYDSAGDPALEPLPRPWVLADGAQPLVQLHTVPYDGDSRVVIAVDEFATDEAEDGDIEYAPVVANLAVDVFEITITGDVDADEEDETVLSSGYFVTHSEDAVFWSEDDAPTPAFEAFVAGDDRNAFAASFPTPLTPTPPIGDAFGDPRAVTAARPRVIRFVASPSTPLLSLVYAVDGTDLDKGSFLGVSGVALYDEDTGAPLDEADEDLGLFLVAPAELDDGSPDPEGGQTIFELTDDDDEQLLIGHVHVRHIAPEVAQ